VLARRSSNPEPSEVRRLAVTFGRLATEQEDRNPPDAAIRFDGIVVDALKTVSGLFTAVADRDYRSYYDARDRVKAMSDVFDEEQKQIAKRCS
jgi:hypothetical protein